MLKAKDFIPSIPRFPIDMTTTTIRVLRQFYLNGVLQKVGSTIEFPGSPAEVIHSRKAELVKEKPVVAPEPEPEAPKASKKAKE